MAREVEIERTKLSNVFTVYLFPTHLLIRNPRVLDSVGLADLLRAPMSRIFFTTDADTLLGGPFSVGGA